LGRTKAGADDGGIFCGGNGDGFGREYGAGGWKVKPYINIKNATAIKF